MTRWLLLFLALTLFPVPASAQADAPLFDYQVTAKTQTDQGPPVLILRAREFIKSGTVTLDRGDGKPQTIRLGRMKPGKDKRIAFRQPKGAFKWKVTVKGESQFGQTTNQVFETETAYVDPIQLSVDPEKAHVGDGKLILRSNVPIDKVDIEVFDNNGEKYVETTASMGGKAGDLEVTWTPARPEVGAIRLKAHDVAGFWSAVLLEPFWVDIPHKEVVFHFGKATWDDAETPKLEETLKGVHKAMKRHARKGLRMQLYIAGYTDTVGGNADNMKLSTARARAIARWFRKSGIELPILYQGFGESVQAVQTPDNTPEARNRRAVYILGNSPPPKSPQIPRGAWKRL